MLVLSGVLRILQAVQPQRQTEDVITTSQVLPEPAEQQKEIRTFAHAYVDTIQRGDFTRLQADFWLPSVVPEIKAACSESVVGERASIESSWASCAYFHGLDATITAVRATDLGYQVDLHFTAQAGQTPLGVPPTLPQTVTISIASELGRLRTADWKLFR